MNLIIIESVLNFTPKISGYMYTAYPGTIGKNRSGYVLKKGLYSRTSMAQTPLGS